MQYEYFTPLKPSSSLLPHTQSAIYRAELQELSTDAKVLYGDPAGSNEFVAEKSMVRCTETRFTLSSPWRKSWMH